MRSILFTFLLGITFFGNAQQTFETGKIIDSVSISNSTTETFALYLPKSYDASKPLPVVFIFEPAARGRIGIEPFIEASKTYEYILICSNDARNGSYERNFDIASRLFDSVFLNFKIKKGQVFLAGFSGGSRLASAIAVLTNQITGVVGCGAGFSMQPSHVPSIQNFLYAGVCGNRDMNYTEMIRAQGYLKRFNFTNALFTYDGNHSWPPSNEILKAFDWLDIQSHIKGIKMLTNDRIYQSYKKNYSIASVLETTGKPVRAVEYYERILTTYGALLQLDSISLKLKKLKKSKAYKIGLKLTSRAFDKEAKLTEKFYARFRKDFNDPDHSDLDWWKNELDAIQESSDPEMNIMIERLRFKIYALAFTKINPNLYQSTSQQKEFCNHIIKLMQNKI